MSVMPARLLENCYRDLGVIHLLLCSFCRLSLSLSLFLASRLAGGNVNQKQSTYTHVLMEETTQPFSCCSYFLSSLAGGRLSLIFSSSH